MSDPVPRDQPIIKTPSRIRSLTLPDLVSDRLDDLVTAMQDRGYRADRSVLVAALICHADPRPQQLFRLTQGYHEMTVGEAVLNQEGSESVEARPTRKGPRTRVTGSPGR